MARRAICCALLLLITLIVPRGPVAAQSADGLDTPLLSANMCGDGLADEVHFTLAATGDTFPHENIQAAGEERGYNWLFDHLRPFLRAADLAYTNFDGAMLAGSPRSGYPQFNYNPALAAALKNAGIGLVSTANNHILDRGPAGLDATLDVLDQAGILHHGAVRSTATGHPPYLPITLSRDGVSITIGFISATWGTNGIPDPANQVNLLYQSNSYGSQGGVRQSVLDAVAQAAAETDLVLVAAHWGFEYEFYPAESQREAARALAAAGADVILGAQPHTLQPVELIETGSRRTLVAYSLANFLASQGALQRQYYSATSVVFYLGLARSSDGNVRLTGYRYLPTIHIDGDTRPAPIVPNTLPEVENHVQTILRDPGGLRRLPADPPVEGAIAPICPPLQLAEAPDVPIGGDFAQHYATLGDGLTPRPLTEAIAVFGLPLGPVVRELSEDCETRVSVLYTERQRLELRAFEPWPYRVTGALLGAAVYRQRYGDDPPRRTDLAGAEAFADPRFRSFYEMHGGLHLFGYPISGALQEGERTVQYFERARFELTPAGEVQLGLLSAEYAGIAAQCGLSPTPVPAVETAAGRTETTVEAPTDQSEQAAITPVYPGWLGPVAAVLILLIMLSLSILAWMLIGIIVGRRRTRQRRRGYRTGARERVAARRQTRHDAELLRRLLEE